MSTLTSTRPNNPFRGFGDRTKTEAPKEEQKKGSEFYINIGYTVTSTHPVTNEPADTFVSLQQGIGLDFIKRLDPSKEKSQFHADIADAKNGLLDAFMEKAQQLEPGASCIIMEDEATGLQVEIKRIKGESTVSEENVFKKAFSLR